MTLFRPVTHEGWKICKQLQHAKMVVEVSEQRRNREGLDTAFVGWLLKQLERGVVWLFGFLLQTIIWFVKVLYRAIGAGVKSFFDYLDRKICERAQKIKDNETTP